MKYLTVSTTRLPDGRLVLERKFVADVVDAINQLNDEIKDINRRLDGHDGSVVSLRKGISDVNDAVAKANDAVRKVVNAVELLTGGEN